MKRKQKSAASHRSTGKSTSASKEKVTGKTGSRARPKTGSRHSPSSGKRTIPGNILEKDFREFIECLNEHEVKYLVVGGYAVVFHGQSRFTKDLDVWVKCDENNAERIVSALDEFGIGSLGQKKEDFLNPNNFMQIGIAPWRIDIINDLIGVEFDNCYEKKVVIESEGVTVNFIDLESLLTNKKATGRHRDLADLEDLQGE